MLTYLEEMGVVLSEDLKNDLQRFFKLKKFKKGDFFHREGTVCTKIGFLQTGKINHYYNLDGKMQTRWVSLPESFVVSFGSFVNQVESFENLECITKCRMLVANRNDFYRLKENHTMIQQLWTRSIEQELIGFETRVFHLISNNAEQRYLSFIKTYPHYIQEVPLRYLASMLGIEPRHLSRIRNNLASKK